MTSLDRFAIARNDEITFGPHPEVLGAQARSLEGRAPAFSGLHPSRLAELVIRPATSGRTRWLAPQDEANKQAVVASASRPLTPSAPDQYPRSNQAMNS